MRILVATALLAALAGCGSNGGDDTSRVDRCIERLLTNAEGGETEAARDYVRRIYCGPFASQDWVYEDGALGIDAQKWLDEGGMEECGSEHVGTVPCVEVSRTIDCALLRHVRRSEAREYVASLGREVECDDGTPIDQLGVP